ncbi:amino acid adenylation domain-containing protein [Wukongibacter sp. M2B1]|uniref:amino acid adenylation domain-containing protein n=1 Tax=Wukongibacter sp. M2B1 TaxID=3088895 RepID=UPI003D78D5CF
MSIYSKNQDEKGNANIYPLSSYQKDIWLDQCLYPESPIYNIGGYLEVEGKMKKEIFEKAVNILINNNASLRMSVVVIENKPYQKINNELMYKVPFYDFSHEKQQREYCLEWMRKEFIRVFEDEEKMFEFILIKASEEHFFVLLKAHHRLVDGWGYSILIKELVANYNSLLNNVPIKNENEYSYLDFIEENEKYLKSEKYTKDIEFWKEKYPTIPEPLFNWISDSNGFLASSIRSSRRTLIVKRSLYDEIMEFSKEKGCSIFHFILGVIYIYFSKACREDDLVIGVPIVNRKAKYKQTIGHFANVIPLRINPNGDITFIELIKDIKSELRRCYRHQNLPAGEIHRAIYEQARNRDNIFQISLSYEKSDYTADFAENKTRLTAMTHQHERNGLTIFVREFYEEDDVKIDFDYQLDIFEKIMPIENVVSCFESLLSRVMENSEKNVSEIEIVTKEEKKRILYDFNDTKIEYAENRTIKDLVEEQVEKTPDRIAVVFEDTQLTYRELNSKSNELADKLIKKGIKRNDRVAVLMDHSIELTISIFAIMKAGATFVPIDVNSPDSRIKENILDIDCKTVLINSKTVYRDKDLDESLLIVEEDELKGKKENLNIKSDLKELIYIIYTSGSTGKPKGVMISHRGIVNRFMWMNDYFGKDSAKAVLQTTRYVYDSAVWQIFWPLINGGKTVTLPPNFHMTSENICELIEKHRVTITDFVPSVFNVIVKQISDGKKEKEMLSSLKNVVLGGEEITPFTTHKFLEKFPEIRITNLYGPTEASIGCIYYRVKGEEGNKIPIGKPISNMEIYIMDKYRNLVPIGIDGEIYIGGRGVGLGYINNIEKSEEVFLDNPFRPSEKMYRTGDLARWLPDGNIEFLGRIDHQVKIRGFRIEPGEIEAQLLKHGSVKEAVVIDRKGKDNDKYLCAYIVSEEEISVSDLRKHLSKELPEYMVPSYFVQLEKIPLTPNGKIDRRSLPLPEGNISTGVEYEAPSSITEEKLVEIWKEILGIEKIGINDNFFSLGGHSLRAAAMVSKIHKEMNVEVPLREVFRLATVKSLAKYIKEAKSSIYIGIQPVEKKEYYLLSSAQKRLYVLNQLEGRGIGYNMPSAMLLRGDIDKERIEETFRKLVKRHEALRTYFKLVEGEPMQVVEEEVEFKVETRSKGKERVDDIVREFIRPFELDKAPLFRVGMIEISENEHILMLDMHHIISDGVSSNILTREFTSQYEGKKLPELKIQYKDFTKWQNDLLKGEAIKKQEEYWLEVFSGEIPVLNMPTDYPRPSLQSFKGDRMGFKIDEGLVRDLRSIAAETGSTMYMVILAAYNVLLSKYSGQEDIVVGSTIAGRPHPDLEEIMGMFVNTLAMRNQAKGEKSFREFLLEVKEKALKAYENQDYQFEELVEKLSIPRDMSRNPLFDTMFTMQNIESEELKIEDVKFETYGIENKAAKFDLTLSAVEAGEIIEFDLEYCTELYKKETIQRLSRHFKNILRKIAENPEESIDQIDMLTKEEKRQLLIDFNDTKREYPRDKTIHELFEEQVERSPDNIALIFEDKEVTYRELNERSNQLARVLRKRGVGPETIVGIMVERSIEMIVGILGILKSGGAYLPIDPGYPEERIRFMIEDSGTNMILVKGDLLERVKSNVQTINLEDKGLYQGDNSNQKKINEAHDLAYIIYTSGTTGKPKGVMIQHRSIADRIGWRKDEYKLGAKDNVLQLFSYSFDGFMTSFFTPIVSGSRVIILREEEAKDINAIKKHIVNRQITHFISVPTLYGVLLECMDKEDIKSLRIVTLAGEKIGSNIIKESRNKNINLEIVNEYGPTEGTVVSTILRNVGESITIGKPIVNTKIYIVDKNLRMQPIGVEGEICISGNNLAKGYLNRPELTVEKFVENPFVPDERMYRTGDLGRWLPDGNIEFLGRIDHQVKIRGFRIELGEIEAELLKHGSVKEAVVIDREDEEGHKYLCGYIVAKDKLSVSDLRKHLLKELPEHMIPSYFVELESIPLTLNDKIDRKALPEPDGSINTGVEYAEPKTENEEILIKVWEDVLKVEGIGIKHSFFNLGGDSIKAIQVLSRLNSYGLKLEMKDLFKNPVIEDLNDFIKSTDKKIEQGLVKGELGLTPIQKWLFETNFEEKHHFNQDMILYREEGFKEKALERVLKKLVEHHDALRIVIREERVQYNREVDGELYSLEIKDLREAEDYRGLIKEEGERIQSSIDIGNGPLVKAALFKTKEGDHLLIVIHHLVVDGISWRIILEDLSVGYSQALKNEEIRFEKKTDSFKTWSDKLYAYGNSEKLLEEIEYWEGLEGIRIKHLPRDASVEIRRNIDSDSIDMELTTEDTEKLLNQVNRAYNTEINDILLTTLGLTIGEWTKESKVLVNLEGHGREEIIEDIDVSRTVGWFTSQYPVLLDIEEESLSQQIKAIKESIRNIPNKGVGYGILKYLTSWENRKGLSFNLEPEISFNYLGQFDGDIDKGVFKVSDIDTGKSASPNFKRQHAVDINGMVIGGKFKLDFTYDKNEYKRTTIMKLTKDFKENLIDIINHCVDKEDTELTLSDFSSKKLTTMDLEKIYSNLEEKKNIKDIYSLIPMQAGMLHHSLLDRDSYAYFEQMDISIKGSLDVECMERSFNSIIERYDVFRTIFVHEKVRTPMQVVMRERRLKIDFKDVTDLSYEYKEGFIEEFKAKDREKGFNLSRDMLMRVSILRIDNNLYRLIWSFHHIIMDGWCLGIILKDLFEIYGALRNDRVPSLEKVYPYSSYIKWLEESDRKEAAEYWKQYLQEYEQKAGPPELKVSYVKKEYEQLNHSFKIVENISNSLEEIARKNNTTLSTVMQAVWGILLQRYSNTDDVVFGAVVSGRPSEVKGIERMVGLFINTVPVRVKSDGGKLFSKLLEDLGEDALQREKYSYYPLAEIQSMTSLKGDLINNIMIFENYPMDEAIVESESVGFKIIDTKSFEQTSYDFNLIVVPGKELSVKFSYNGLVYDKEFVKGIEGHFKAVIDEIVGNDNIPVKDIDILTKEEKRQLLIDFNDTKREYPRDKTIHELFEEQVERSPDNIALIFEDKEVTYRELNERSNQLARVLRKRGVGPETIVGIMVERSIEMIVGILGILKAGGAYLPIDPGYPEERIRFMIEDSGTDMILVKGDLLERVKSNVQTINLEDKGLYQGDNSNQKKINEAHDLAYIIYTSGTTGKPKGVMIQHRSIADRIGWRKDEYKLGAKDNVLQLFSYSFDGFMTSFFTPIVSGSRVIILREEEAKDINAIKKHIVNRQITHFISVPTLYGVLLECMDKEDIKSLRIVTLAGEKIGSNIIKESRNKNINLEIVNEYGPTEGTVVSTILRNVGESITIGKPIVNTKIYIVDKNLRMQPIGVEGEICISGNNLAKGYLNRPELTVEKFVENPFVPDERMYRTGDLGRWLPDGNIEFLGRIDHQVKIRGFRIELGEIEAELLKHGSVKEAVVIDREDEEGHKYLCGYIVAKDKLSVSDLRKHLLKELPEHMVPSYFVELESIPLTLNDKIDRKALPEPDGSINTGVEYAEPKTENEEILIKVWEDVLKVEGIGIKHSFFNLGGDSIKAIQVLSRLNSYGLKLEMKDLFKNPVIEDLNDFIKSTDKKIEQGLVKGELGLTPIQKWLFETNFEEKHHFNQDMILYREEGFKEKALERVLKKLVEHHDALRIVIREERVQYNRELDGELYSLEIKDLREAEDYRGLIKEEAERIQSSIDIGNGPLVKAALFKTKEGDHLLIVIHHLVVDGISWRIILEDLSVGYSQALKNEEIRFEKKTDSFKTWSDKLYAYGNSEKLLEEIEYWEGLEGIRIKHLPRDASVEIRRNIDSDSIDMELTTEDTEKLLNQVNRAYNTEINDILLTTLGLTIGEWTKEPKVLVNLEGHGREEIIEDIDVSRTVGWFTSQYPVLLDIEEESLSQQIKAIKESIRNIPNKGVGYGILKYLTSWENRKGLSFNLEPEISFNYLGQFDGDIDKGVFKVSDIDTGKSASPNFKRQHAVDINGMVIGGKFKLDFTYDKNEYKRTTIMKLAKDFKENLIDIINHCVDKEDTELTLSDFSTKKLTMEDVEEIYYFLEERG